MQRYIELLYLLVIDVLAPQLIEALASLLSAMQSRFCIMIVFLIVLQSMNVSRLICNETPSWRRVYGILIALNILAFALLSQLSVFCAPIAVLEIVGSMQL